MADTFTTTTSTSFFGRARNALIGFLLGPLLLIGAAILIFWNETHSVRVIKSLNEGAAAVQEANAGEFDAAANGRLLHLTGTSATDETLHDETFGVEATGIRLMREVEVYEWTEKEKSSSTSTSVTGTKTKTKTYEYDKKWDKTLHQSSHFKQPAGHENPTKLKYNTTSWSAKQVTLGAYELDPALTAKIKNADPISLTEDSVELPDGAKLADNQIYVGEDPENPSVGDLRISEELVPTGPVSVIAQQGPGNRLAPFHAKAGEDVGLVQTGEKSAAEMFRTAQSENRLMTWLIRGGGFLLLLFGFLFLLGPLSEMASIIPFLGGIVEAGAFFVALVLAVFVWLALVGAAWMVARPVLGVTFLALAVAAAVFVVKHLHKHAAAAKQAAAAA